MQSPKKRIVIIGGNSTIAEHCARLWVSGSAVDLTLVVRDRLKAESIAADLRIRNPQSVIRVREAHFTEPSAIQAVADESVDQGGVDIVLIAHGALPNQALCQQNLSLAHEALTINGVSPALFAEAFAGHMIKAGRGTLAIIGSVAGDRGRKSNYVYGAAKGLLARYTQGLQHRLAATNVKVVLIKPGPTETPMTAQLNQQLAPVKDVARCIVDGIDRGKPIIYTPAKWRWIMAVVRHLPRFIFNSLNI
ncbi:SDR family NAD(P)-dependent oxidoreductase [Candidatus Methylobacter oryzae]|uniref:SDR family NAD(P)-dependent oxidoreductase n=1 Tax=Candidatus Methylobacter oryzae TaxID=2497749 RepID=A0ABY3CER2_9GAMM|nr:SDR family NAD(P)-dependent oxidoreductase [Candidatus Methylobacter oryzae]TRX01765.1 SDR family NAD(P)-dependent oxidoreductase [Candidatus Methylobacter oryzae]